MSGKGCQSEMAGIRCSQPARPIWDEDGATLAWVCDRHMRYARRILHRLYPDRFPDPG